MKVIRFWFCLWALATTFAVAAPTPSKRLVVGVEMEDQFPIYRGSDTGSYIGYARDLLDQFAAANGYDIEYRMLPIARLYDEFLRNHTVDLKFPDNPSWQAALRRGQHVDYSDPAIRVTEGLFVPPGKVGEGLADIATIGAIRGFTPQPYLSLFASGKIRYVEVNGFDSLLRMGLAHRVDGVYANTVVTDYYLSQVLKQPEGLLFDPSLPHMQVDFRLSSIKRPDVVQQFNAYLAHHQAEIARLRAKYSINP